MGRHLSPAHSAVAREAGAPGSSAVRRLPWGGDVAGERRVATALPWVPVTVSCRAFASGREGRCRVGCHEAGVRAAWAARPVGFRRLRGWVPLGGAALAGEGAVSQYSPDRRVIVSRGGVRPVSCRVPRGLARGPRSPLPPAEGAGCRLAGPVLAGSPGHCIVRQPCDGGIALGPRRDRPRGPRSPLGRWASTG